ncbi:MAG: hypothetical protein HY268_10490 [Deltaproteobacteria bacterium]|nr:hypothetical protein [Deltaproteobacteria bacterium]
MNTASTVRIAVVKALAREGIALPNTKERQVTIVNAHSRDPGSATSDQRLTEDGKP